MSRMQLNQTEMKIEMHSKRRVCVCVSENKTKERSFNHRKIAGMKWEQKAIQIH